MNLERVKSMEVEIEGEDGSKLSIGPQKSVFGRASGFHTKDRTVSRRHVCFQLSESEGGGRVSFEVIGRNPIWVCSHLDQSLTLFRKFEKGHLEFGDRFSLSAKTPVWFHLNSNQVAVAEVLNKGESDTEGSSSRVDLDIDHIDLSKIDPVKEFGFLVIGHEFDQYPKCKIRDVKDWEWFLDEPSKDSDDDDDDENKGKERRKMKRKRKKGKDNDEDEEWRGESEDDKDIAARIRKGKRPEYSTRSKDSGKGPNRGTSSSSRTSSKQKKTSAEEDDDDDDETLGGFIVDDEEDDKEENDDEEEEEEFEEDEEND